MTTDNEKLAACPFCGGEAKRHTIGEDEPSNAGGDVIACTRCGASSHVEFGRKENLVSAWNTRTPQAGGAEQVREAAAKLCDDIATEMGERWIKLNNGLPESQRDYQNGRIAGYSDGVAYAAKEIRAMPLPTTTDKERPTLRKEASLSSASVLRPTTTTAAASTTTDAEQVKEAADCEHDWRYTGTDHRGSHKGEDHYDCHKCGAWQYRLDDVITFTSAVG